MSATVAESLPCMLQSQVQSWQVEIFNKIFLPVTRRDGRAQPQSLVSVPNIPVLNPKSLCRVCDVKAYVLL
jgi:hypothetical protein